MTLQKIKIEGHPTLDGCTGYIISEGKERSIVRLEIKYDTLCGNPKTTSIYVNYLVNNDRIKII